MYTSYFGFRIYPFEITPDPQFFYMTPLYHGAYTHLLSAIREQKGLIVLTGESGTGKTLLLRKVTASLEETFHPLLFHYTTFTFPEMLAAVCDTLHLPATAEHDTAQVQTLKAFLAAQSQTGINEVLIIDEAQDLDAEFLDRLHLLLDLETTSGKPLQIVLAGQPELATKLASSELRHLWQRIETWCRLDHLQDTEVGPFIHYRLRIAGYERQDLFVPDAIQRIAQYSQGIPRLINVICDNALRVAYTTGQKTVSAKIIEDVASDCQLKKEPQLPEVSTKAPLLPTEQVPVTLEHPQAEGPQAYHPWLRRWPQRLAWGGIAILIAWFAFLKYDSVLQLANVLPKARGNAQLSTSPFPKESPPMTVEWRTPPLPPGNLKTAKTQTVQPQESPAAARAKQSSRGTANVPSSTARSNARPEEKKLPGGQTPVAELRRQRDHARAQLAQMGIPVNERALLDSIEARNAHVAELLLAAGVSANAKDKQGWTALMLAARDNQADLMQALLARGANVNAKNTMGGTALIMAALNNHPAIVQILLNKGAHINAKNNQGWTALMYATWKGHRSIVETLLNKGADVTLTDKEGWTALMYATWQEGSKTDQVRLDDNAAAVLIGDASARAIPVPPQDYREIANLLTQAEQKRY
jgi:type II secretory pathway predicted ATPase ExeA